MLKNKKILVGVTGGIAAYKTCYLVRELIKAGAEVKVVMTPVATKFVSPLTFSTLSKNEVAVDLWTTDQSTSSDIGTKHIDLALWPDLMLIVPASANTIAKIVHGFADNLLTTLVLAIRCPMVAAPTMDADMFTNPITQQNIEILQELGCFILPPGEGEHASGLYGPGRLPEVETILKFVDEVLNKTYQDLKGKKILITAGPTYEPIDPVRFIGNRSSGRMGFSLANAAALRGAEVTLVSGPVTLRTPRNVQRIDVGTATEMYEKVLQHAEKANVVIMAAAVADFTLAKPESQKIKKEERASEELQLTLSKAKDILQSLGEKKNGKLLVGFALETENEIEHAKSKLKQKNLDLIVLNNPFEEGAGFATGTNVVTIIHRSGKVERLQKMSKFDVANEILNRVVKLFR